VGLRPVRGWRPPGAVPHEIQAWWLRGLIANMTAKRQQCGRHDSSRRGFGKTTVLKLTEGTGLHGVAIMPVNGAVVQKTDGEDNERQRKA
jgi:hypothetical protein